MDRPRVLIKGAGDLASAVAHRLYAAGFLIAMTEIPAPLSVRRGVSFSEAVYDREKSVEGVLAQLVSGTDQIERSWRDGLIAVLVDPQLAILDDVAFDGLVEATLSKKKTPGIDPSRASAVVALGPGWSAPDDVHFVVETQRGHDLGRVIHHGQAAPNTGIPGAVQGFTHERILRAPCDGRIFPLFDIGYTVEAGAVVATVAGVELKAAISGILRGMHRAGTPVTEGLKVGDVDPRGNHETCYTISDKGRAVAGGVLEALLSGGIVDLKRKI
ncbi:selenium-dependent molybdenum cofactor biosynthesis protein YqeB [Acidobacteriota bacterium]